MGTTSRMVGANQPSCSLCHHDELERQIVTETANFLVLAVGQPLVEGHVLVVPRVHAPCMAALPSDLAEELARLKGRVARVLAETFGPPALFELCNPGDPASHAHLHAVPGAPDLIPNLGEGAEEGDWQGVGRVSAAQAAEGRHLHWERDERTLLIADDGRVGDRVMALLSAALSPPARQGREAARSLRRTWQGRMAAAGEPVEVVACVLRRSGRVCLLRRSFEQDSAPGLWHVVSGYLPDGTEPLQQALREIEQEVGLERAQVSLARAGRPLTFGSPAVGHMWRIHPFLFDLLEGEPRLNWEHIDLVWVDPADTVRYPSVPWLPTLVERLVEGTVDR